MSPPIAECRHSWPLGPAAMLPSTSELCRASSPGISRSESKCGRKSMWPSGCLNESEARSSTADGNASSIAVVSERKPGSSTSPGHQQLHVLGVAREREAAVPVRDAPDVVRVAVDDDARVDPGAPAGERERAVGRGVVDDHDADVDPLLRQHRVDAALDRRLGVADGDADGHAGARLVAEHREDVRAEDELPQFARDARLGSGCRHAALIGQGRGALRGRCVPVTSRRRRALRRPGG